MEGRQSFTVKFKVNCRIFIAVLYQAVEFLFCHKLAESFYHKWVLDFIKCFCVMILGGTSNKEISLRMQWDAGDTGLIPGWGRSPGEGNGNTQVFLPRKSYGQRSLAGYSSWGCKESDVTEHTAHTESQWVPNRVNTNDNYSVTSYLNCWKQN